MTDMWHRIISLVVVAVYISSLLCGCSDENASQKNGLDSNDKIILSVNEESVSPEGITLNIKNELEETIFLNPWYRLEKLSEKGWVAVEPIQGVNWAEDDWQMSIYTDTQRSKEYLWEWYYGKLTTGEYRISVLILTGEKDTSSEYTLAATFSIP